MRTDSRPAAVAVPPPASPGTEEARETDDAPTYDPDVPRSWYDRLGNKEWTRLTNDRNGELLFHVHMDILRAHVPMGSSILELGAGAGFITKELAHLGGRLVVSDLSERQLELNRQKMDELRLVDRVAAFRVLDVTCLAGVGHDEFDVVVCVGGALNYTFDRAQEAVDEMIRVTRPGGTLVLGVISLTNSLIRYLPAVLSEKRAFGIEATRWLFDTGIQDEAHYPVPDRHFLKMMRSDELDALYCGRAVDVVERRAAGVWSLAGEQALSSAREDEELWPLILESEIALSR